MHWALATAVALAWLSGEGLIGVAWHEPSGYAALGIVLCRVVWGFVGSPYARFVEFLRRPHEVWRYVRQVAHGREPRFVGHNPLGGWMVAALLLCIAALGATGWLYTTDRFWGEPWLDGLHQALAWSLLTLIAIHLGGVVFTSHRHGENLVAAMISGDKNPRAGDMGRES
jgi:cytochrome b